MFNLYFFLMFPFFFTSGLLMMLVSFFLSCLNSSFFVSWSFYLCSFMINFPLFLDFISCFFIGLVLLISASILMYSEYYMQSDMYKSRFFFLMFFFVLSMVFLILSPSSLCMLLGWDGLGLVSYCLVIYYQSYSSFCSGMLTALTNRLGDVFILCSLSMMFSYGGWNYMNFLNLDNWFFFFFFFLGSLTKSAQIPFSSWLPAAMAAPTPVSSLVHSSTLVTAGVYILIRFHYYLEDWVKSLLMFISLLTMIMSGISGMYEYDLKKIIALSTLSQLGFMMSSISLGFEYLAFFHLCTHACFKALLFMCAGTFIHSFMNNQDIRGFGFLGKDYFLVICLFNIGSLSLCGFPFLSGFFSKDLILEMLFMKKINFFFFFLFCFGTFLTVLYSFRLFSFMGFKFSYVYCFTLSLNNWTVIASMMILFFLSITMGFMGSNLFFFPLNYIILPLYMKVLVLFICISSFFLTLVFSYISKFSVNFFSDFLFNMWFMYFLKTGFLNFVSLSSFYKLSFCNVGFIEYYLGQKMVSVFFNTFFWFSRSLKESFFLFFFFFFFFNCFFLMYMI